MKIFISWSGPHSLGIATALRDWLPILFSGIELFVSAEDIRKGKRWPVEVSKELETSNLGIICLTPDNLEAPWIMFEAGALSKSVKEASVYTLLSGGLKAGDIDGPLSHFQHTVFEKGDVLKLVKSINEAQGQVKRDEALLTKLFGKFWEELEANVSKAVKNTPKPEKTRSEADMLNELLEITRSLTRTSPDVDALKNMLFTTQARIQELERQLKSAKADTESGEFVIRRKKAFGRPMWEEMIKRIRDMDPHIAEVLSHSSMTSEGDKIAIHILGATQSEMIHIRGLVDHAAPPGFSFNVVRI